MSTDKNIHIVSFDVPYPPNYGGVVDVYYRLIALHSMGYNIILHCFEYGRGQHTELESITSRVYYYKRDKSIRSILNSVPYIVRSRKSEELLTNLKSVDAPILFEGLHTTYHLNDKSLKNRIKLVRTHNIEHDYYNELAKSSRGWKKSYFGREAKKLRIYEKNLSFATALMTIQQNDFQYFKTIHNKVHLLPASLPKSIIQDVATRPFCLFHGNLSVPENDNSAKWIIENVVKFCPEIPFTFAGKNPSEHLKKLCALNNVFLVSNPTNEEMALLLSEAQIHVLHTEQPTGLKLKLLSALQSNGDIVANKLMLEGTNLDKFCSIVNSPTEYLETIQRLYKTLPNKGEVNIRQKDISDAFDTVRNCQIISELCGYQT